MFQFCASLTRELARPKYLAAAQLQVRAEATSTLATHLPVTPAGQKALRRADSIDQSASLSLDNIRQSLIRQEDTIIFSLIERAQFAANQPVYESGAMPVPGASPL